MTDIIIISVLAFIAIVSPLLSIYMRRQRFNAPDEEHANTILGFFSPT